LPTTLYKINTNIQRSKIVIILIKSSPKITNNKLAIKEVVVISVKTISGLIMHVMSLFYILHRIFLNCFDPRVIAIFVVKLS